jgi:hypothetical protein
MESGERTRCARLLLAGALLLAAAGVARGGWLFAAGYGGSVRLGPGRTRLSLISLNPQWSRPLGRRFEYVLEGNLTRAWDPDGVFGGLFPIGIRFHGGGSIAPHASLGAGFGWTDLAGIEELDRRFNFALQGGLGVTWGRDGRRRLLEARLTHLSNANTAGRNLGLNSVVVVVGFGWR